MKIMERPKEEKNIILSLILISINIIYATICYTLIYPNIDSDTFNKSTYYLIRADFFIAFLPLNIITFIFFMKFGKLTFSEIGLKKSGFFKAFIFVFLIWWSTQLFYFYTNLVLQITPLTKPYLSNPIALPYFLGEFIVEFLGNSLFEEILYRGVFFTQLFIYIKKKGSYSTEETQILISILISQCLFALVHIPNRFLSGFYTIDEAIIGIITPFIFGIFIAFVYYLSNNLFICIGFHGLGNIGISIFSTVFPPTQWPLYAIFFLIFFYTIFSVKTIEREFDNKLKNKGNLIDKS